MPYPTLPPAVTIVADELLPNPEGDVPPPLAGEDEDIDGDRRFFMREYELRGYFYDSDLTVCFHLRPVMTIEIVVPEERSLRLQHVCAYRGRATDCGYEELDYERQRRVRAGEPLLFPSYPIVFPSGHRPAYIFPNRIITGFRIIEPKAVKYATQELLLSMRYRAAPIGGLQEEDDSMELDSPPTLQPLQSTSSRATPAHLPAPEQQKPKPRTRTKPPLPPKKPNTFKPLVIGPPVERSKSVPVNENNYAQEDNEQRVDQLLRYLRETKGRVFIAPLLHELLEYEGVWPYQARMKALMLLKDVGKPLTVSAGPGKEAVLVYARPTEPTKKTRINDVIDIYKDKSGMNLSKSDTVPGKMDLVISLLGLSSLSPQLLDARVPWLKIKTELETVRDLFIQGKQAAQFGNEGGHQSDKAMARAVYEEVVFGAEPEESGRPEKPRRSHGPGFERVSATAKEIEAENEDNEGV